MNTINFLCSSCGACCKNVGNLPLPSTNGICNNLDLKTNKCKIYNTRPDICRVDKVYEHFKDKYTLKEWFIENTKACHTLIDQQELDKSFKIDINLYERK
jgi:hypothetical protein